MNELLLSMLLRIVLLFNLLCEFQRVVSFEIGAVSLFFDKAFLLFNLLYTFLLKINEQD